MGLQSVMSSNRVRPGVEVLAAQNFRSLSGLNIGLVTNPTGVLPNLASTVDVLKTAPGVKLRALFGPEHGVRGDTPAGKYVASATDPQTGLPVYSLYGPTKSPTASMLKGLDAVVYDIQDIGSRSYTYVSTLGAVMEGLAKHKIPLIVLDRPNPVGLTQVEGGPVQPGFFSFVGKYPLAYRHGMTLGEIARMINGEGWLPSGAKCDLTVINCENLTRLPATWDALGNLPWVPTSPHIPQASTSHFYAATGIIGELPSLSIGVGYPLPFELSGAPDIGPASLANELNKRNIPGVIFRPASWTPYYAVFKGENCGGVQVHLMDPARVPLTRLNFEIIDALRVLDKKRSWMPGKAEMFDLSCGTNTVRKAFLSGARAADLWSLFNEGRDKFVQSRAKYLLYR